MTKGFIAIKLDLRRHDPVTTTPIIQRTIAATQLY